MSAIDTLDGFLALLREELGLDVTAREAGESLVNLPRWDSLHLLRLVTLMEEETGRRLSLSPVLQARTLTEIHTVVLEQVGGRSQERPQEQNQAQNRVEAQA
ncbi:acyl carrier protein [Streptomyces olivochromogenes]|uniref:acyl carrier protein n=1 Tax=Streptomyces olivochromogenes TaxID=1963 RepID=UPI001F2F3A76|nr:acyl carrier protein [Streptomyces olivochromogenes]MCF3131977.1 acyl carrier protein [Streptomyces olivochromogenes]